jgi:hypothetical protein
MRLKREVRLADDVCSEPEGNMIAYVQAAGENVDGEEFEPYEVTKHTAMLAETGQCPWCGMTEED